MRLPRSAQPFRSGHSHRSLNSAALPAPRRGELTGRAAVVTAAQMSQVLQLLEQDPVNNVVTLSWLQSADYNPARLGAKLWGFWQPSDALSGDALPGEVTGHLAVSSQRSAEPQTDALQLQALCFAGANLMPTPSSPAAVKAFANLARGWGKHCSSLVGPADTVAQLWQELAPSWGPARRVRAQQPVMVLDQPVQVAVDRRVRLVRPEELDVFLPAAVTMFTEEVGISPVAGPGRLRSYRARVAELIAAGQAFAWIEDGQVLFKAEVGALANGVAQIQGVWLAPQLRGQGLAVPAMAAVAEMVQVFLAPVVSLYVNDFNAAARATYARVGFREVGTTMTVML